MANQPYRLLAVYCDRFFTFHHGWFQRARRRILGKILRRVESACDLACGTGTTALALARGGLKVFAVDASSIMCRVTRQKAVRARASLRVVQADMRSFRLPEPVGLVTCEYDALNHVPRKSDLARVARAVSGALRPGGYFYFDVNNRRAFEKLWPGNWQAKERGVALTLEGGYDARRVRGWIKAEWYLRKGHAWRRFRERVEEVCWTSAEFRSALRRAGFDRIRTWDAAPFFRKDRRNLPDCRTFYLARKSLRSKPRAGR